MKHLRYVVFAFLAALLLVAPTMAQDGGTEGAPILAQDEVGIATFDDWLTGLVGEELGMQVADGWVTANRGVLTSYGDGVFLFSDGDLIPSVHGIYRRDVYHMNVPEDKEDTIPTTVEWPEGMGILEGARLAGRKVSFYFPRGDADGWVVAACPEAVWLTDGNPIPDYKVVFAANVTAFRPHGNDDW